MKSGRHAAGSVGHLILDPELVIRYNSKVLDQKEINALIGTELSKLGPLGTSWSAIFVTKFLPTTYFNQEVNFTGNAESCLAAIQLAIGNIRKIDGSATPAVFGIVGSGHLNLNPAIVVAEIESHGQSCTVYLTGIAKEGLIKQGTAKKAVEATVKKIKESSEL